jgi:DNA modification methylase
MKKNDIAYELRPTASLKPRARLARKHSSKQIRQIADSIEQFGFLNPIIVDENGTIIAGHARWLAAKLLGLAEVPTVQVSSMTEDEKRAYVILDNRLAELSDWDFDVLREEMQLLLDADLSFDIGLTGFDASDIDGWAHRPVVADEEPVELPGSAPVVTQPGDLWTIGGHRLLCSNALEPGSYDLLMAGQKAQMVFSDPPYNVTIAGNVSGLGKVKHREFAMASGEMSKAGFTKFLRTAFSRMAEVSEPAAIHFICMDWKHIPEITEAGDAVYAELKNVCTWGKTNAGMGTFYRSQTEFVFVFKVGPGKHINNFGLGDKGRHRSNLWTYPGANTFRKGRMEDLGDHPTVKPVQMVHDAILDCSKPKGVILDGFAGVGTTLVAAARAGRRGFGVELDPAYVDCAIRRLEKELGVSATLNGGPTFAEIGKARLQEAA